MRANSIYRADFNRDGIVHSRSGRIARFVATRRSHRHGDIAQWSSSSTKKLIDYLELRVDGPLPAKSTQYEI